MEKIKLPNGSDSLTIHELFDASRPDGDSEKVIVDKIWLLALISDLHYLQGYAESLQWGLNFWRNQADKNGEGK